MPADAFDLFASYARRAIIPCPDQRSIIADLTDIQILEAVDFSRRAKTDSDYITVAGILQEWHGLPDPDGGFVLNNDVCDRLDSMDTLVSWMTEAHSIMQYRPNAKGRRLLNKQRAA